MANTRGPDSVVRYLCALVVLPVVQFSGPKYFKGQCEVVQKNCFSHQKTIVGGGGAVHVISRGPLECWNDDG